MKKIFVSLIISVMLCTISMQSAFATKYNVKVNIFSNEESFSRQAFNYYIDFKQEINLASLKMTVSGRKNKSIPVYVVPIAKYKAMIYFMPHKKMEEDSELYYVLSFESGKWDGKAGGCPELKKTINVNPNLIPNPSFEEVRKTINRFLTWSGRTSVIAWSLQDFSRKFAFLDNLKSSCRVSTKEAFHGIRSLCFINGKPQVVNLYGREKNILISGSASLINDIPLKPDTNYKLSFFVKITKHIDSGMNFQGLGISLSFLDYNKKTIGGGALFCALYSIGSTPEESYLNQWIYVKAYDITDENTHFARISIAEKTSGVTYIDMLELREVKNCKFPEIILGKIIDLTPEKPKPILRRADGTPVK